MSDDIRCFMVVQLASGDVYEGEWDNDLPHGIGRKYYGLNRKDADAGLYIGYWERGMQHGLGQMEYLDDDGHTYSGGWFQGRYAGAGTMTKGKYPSKVHVATGDWTSWTWTSGSWDGPYPREAGRGRCRLF